MSSLISKVFPGNVVNTTRITSVPRLSRSPHIRALFSHGTHRFSHLPPSVVEVSTDKRQPEERSITSLPRHQTPSESSSSSTPDPSLPHPHGSHFMLPSGLIQSFFPFSFAFFLWCLPVNEKARGRTYAIVMYMTYTSS